MSPPPSSSSSTRCPEERLRGGVRLARFRPHRTRRPATPTGSPTTWATSTSCSTPCSPDLPIDLLGHSMGGNVVTVLRRPAPRARPPPRQPRRLWYAAHPARAGAAPLRRVARRPEGEPRVASATRAWQRWQRGCGRRIRCCPPIAPPGWPSTGSDRGPRLPMARSSTRSWATRRTSGRHRCCDHVDETLRVLEAHHGAAAVGRGRSHRHRALVGGKRYTKESSTSACRWWRAWSAGALCRPATCCTTIAPKRWRPGSRTSSRLRYAAPRSPAARAGG